MTLKTLRLSDGRNVVFQDTGVGPVVVLLHGVGMCAQAWGPQIADLAQDHRVIALNLPGHGGSDRLADGARLPQFVDWLGATITALGLGPVSVAGHSMGALIAIGLAIDYPDLVVRLAALNAVHQRSAAARAAVEARAAAIAQGKGDFSQPLSRWFEDDSAQDALRKQVMGWLGAMDQRSYAAAYTAFAEGDDIYSGQWARVKCPALMLTGEDDQNSTAEMTRIMAAAAAQGRAVVIAGHRHIVNLTAPAQVNAALRDWLEKQEVTT